MRVLLTNDDGIEADGLQALRRALLRVPDVQLEVIAPDGNRSAVGRSITTRRPLAVRDHRHDDGTVGHATDGTPVDCVRLANLGLIDGFRPELVVSGINHGANLGDDVTYSGTVAAALEGILLGLPGIAVSQHSPHGPTNVAGGGRGFDFTAAAAFTARLLEQVIRHPMPDGTLINVNVPDGEPRGVAVARLGRRIYHDTLGLVEESDGVRRFEIYGAAERGGEAGSDIAVVDDGRIALTPLHFDLTDAAGMDELERAELGVLLAPVADGAPGR